MKILLLGFGESSGTWTNPQWMAYTLQSLGHTVTYANPPATRKLKLKDISRIFMRFGLTSPINNSINFNIVNLYTSTAIHKFDFFGLLTSKTQRLINEVDQIICFQPIWLKFLYLPVEKCTFYICDDYSALKNSPVDQTEWDSYVATHYKVCVSNEALREKYPRAHFFPNAVPTRYIDEVLEKQKYARVSKTIAFVGTLHGEKLDIELALNFMRCNPELQFKFAGKIFDFDIEPFKLLPNFQYLGELSFAEAVSLMAQSEFAFIPFKRNEYTRHIFSMKYFEYLYCGCKIVTSELPMYNCIPESMSPYMYLSEQNCDISKYEFKDTTSMKIAIIERYSYVSRISKMNKLGLI